MRQRGEKYARRMERRVERLEDSVETIRTEQTAQDARAAMLEDELAVYRAAQSRRAQRAKERRDRKERERKRERIETALRLAACVIVIVLAMMAAMTVISRAEEAQIPEETERAQVKAAGIPDENEAELIEEALEEQGYFSDALPICYEWQDWFRTYAEGYGGERAEEVFLLALAVAERESRFEMDAVGALGEIGIFQLLPGPEGTYHAEIEKATGLDVHTDAGNIAGGIWKLATLLNRYGNANDAAMAYNMGAGGAEKAWKKGIESTEYSRAVTAAMEKWRTALNGGEETT